MPRTKLSTKVQEVKDTEEKMRDTRHLYPELDTSRGMWKVKFTGGGRLPDHLNGWYLTKTDALKSIDLHNGV